VSKDLHGRFTAPDLVKEIAAEIGGSGGGRADLAQAGGGNPEGIDRAFSRLKEVVARKAGGA
jgi:alanyl-tRNA synthetase